MSKDEYDSMKKYGKLYSSYRHLVTQPEGPESKHNKKLIKMMGQDLLKLFKRVDEAMGNKIDPVLFEVTVKKLMDKGALIEEEPEIFLDLETLMPYNETTE